MNLNDPLWATTHMIVLLTAATVACGVVCNKYQKKKKERKDVMGHLLFQVLPILVLLLVGYRTGYLLTIFINLDNYKLRIIFNYLNLHINLYNILTHVFIIMSFSILIY